MSLEYFRRTRVVIRTRHSMAYQAARAMADNHIGSMHSSLRSCNRDSISVSTGRIVP
jgi:hypothetical protein